MAARTGLLRRRADSDWSTGPLHWEPAGGEGDASTVNVIHNGQRIGERIATLDVQPLPD